MTMLYSGVELGRRMWARPATASLSSGAWALRSAPWAMAGGAREWSALMEWSARFGQDYPRPEWRQEEWGLSVEIESAWGTPFGRLVRFKRPGAQDRPKLLIVAPLSGHYPTLLRETVKEMARENDVFVTEWENVRDVPLHEGDFSLADYVDFLRQSLREMAKIDSRPSHAMSVCQPTVPMLAAASMMAQDSDPAAPKSLVMIGGPIDAQKSPTAINNFAQSHDMDWFESRLISVVPPPYAGAGRRVYPGFLQHMGFVAMNPSRHAQAHQRFFESLVKGDEASANKHREFYDEYNAVMDLPAPYYLETIEKVFKNFDLPHGRLDIGGRRVDPSAISSWLLTIEGEIDDISGAGQTHSAQKLCSGVHAAHRTELTVEGVGHYGVFSGSSFRSKVAPQISAFLRAAEEGPKASRPAKVRRA